MCPNHLGPQMYNLLSLNVNGLNDRLKRTALIDWLNCMKADIVCLQETHAASHAVIRGWFRLSNFLVVSSSVSNKKCGTAILVHKRFKINHIRKDEVGRFSSVEVELDASKLCFCSLYAPNKNPARNTFFASLPDYIDLAVPTFLCGDFNCVLDPDVDRRRHPSYTGVNAKESVAALQSLLSATQTFPVWRSRNPHERAFSWDHGSGSFSSRIDMIWAPLVFAQNIDDCQYYTSFFSDHRYLLMDFHVGDVFARGPGVWKFNVSLLDQPNYRSLVKSFWTFWRTRKETFTSLCDWWDQGKFFLREITRCYARSLANERSAYKQELLRKLRQLQRLFDHGDQSAFSHLCNIQEELRAVHLREARASQIRSRSQWAEEGERSSSFFLNLENKHRAKQSITSVRDPSTGRVHHDPFDILATWRAYYSSLFTAEVCDPTAQEAILTTMTRTLNAADAESCEGLLTEAECKTALFGMAKNKTPGSDGFPMEFYVSFWDDIGADLVRVLNLSYEQGQLSTSQRRGLIIVLHKKDDRLEMKNYRPISLLNVDYKIATRAICGRLLSVISTIVESDQTCGVPGRTISTNLAMIRDLIEYAERADLPLAILSLDQEKAFDRVDWGFLQKILIKFGFGNSFRKWISLFYSNVESAVVINGWTSSFFQPSRGVRQGCPLSPLLYVLSIEALACAIRSSPIITGVTLPGSGQAFKCSGYADDTSVAVTTDASIDGVFTVYGQYEQASGAKLNRGKSKGIWLGAWKDRTDTPYGIKWVKHLPLLGATFSAGDYSEATWEAPVAKMEKRLASWKGRQLTFQGKATVINSLALSQIWHLCHSFVIPDWAVKRIRKAVWGFFWSGRRELVSRRTVCLPKSMGGFGVIDFELQSEAFALQWIRRYFALTPGKWKSFFSFYLMSCLTATPAEVLAYGNFPRRYINLLPSYYQVMIRAWFKFDGGNHNNILCLDASSAKPKTLPELSTHATYVIGRRLITPEPHCIRKFLPQYGPLYWSETWQQIHLTSLDRPVVDLNWKVAHGVLYTASRLVDSFGMAGIDRQCHCGADDETLHHLFFECGYARFLVGWVYFHLLLYDPTASPFTVRELLFGFEKPRRSGIPFVIIWMLHVVKHHLWVARCDFRFRDTLRSEVECLQSMIARIKFLLTVLGRRCRSPSQVRAFEKQWLAGSTIGHFEGEKLVFSF